MAGLIQRRGMGAQPQPVSGGVARGRRQNRLHQRGGGGSGGGGGGGNRIPNRGLWQGRTGKAAANQNPEAYFRNALTRAGGLTNSGTPMDQYSQALLARLLDDYNAALGRNQRVNPVKFLRRQHGAGPIGPKGRGFNTGDLLDGEGDPFNDWYSNNLTPDYMVGRATDAGGLAPGGGNADYQRYFAEEYVPQVLAETAGARAADQSLSIHDLLAGRDLHEEARRRYLVRPTAARQFSPANLAGRWSWWE